MRSHFIGHNCSGRSPLIWAIMTAMAISVLVYFYSRDTTLGDDELVYCYVMEMGRTGRSYCDLDSLSRHIETFGDVVESQIDHWQHLSGRTVPHVIEQTFSGVLPIGLFYALNAIMFFFTLLAVVYLGAGRLDTSPYIWLIAIVFLIYLLPDPMVLITSVNRSPNYLWPTLMTCCFIILWDKSLKASRHRFSAKTVLLSVFALIAAWCHEIFTIPVSAALLVYCVAHCLRHRSTKMSLDTKVLTIAYFTGSLLLLASPGNMARVLGNSPSHGTDWIGNMPLTNLLVFKTEAFMSCIQCWVFIIAFALALVLKRHRVAAFLHANALLILCFALSLPWGIAVCVGRPMTGFVVFGCLIVLRMASQLFMLKPAKSARGLILPSVIVLAIIAHLICVDMAQAKSNACTRAAIEDFVKSPDGVVSLPEMDLPVLIKPFIRSYKFTLNPGEISRVYGEGRKMPEFLPPVAYSALSDPDAYFSDKYRFAGNSEFCYFGGEYLWARSLPADSISLHWEYYPVSFSDKNLNLSVKIKRWLSPTAYPQKEKLSGIDSIRTRWGTYYRITPPESRTVKALNTEQNHKQ